MQLHQVRYFLEVAERLHFGKSAKSLGVTQPSLSRGLHLLESELGGPLLERRRSRMRLTALGRLVLPDLRAAVNTLDQTKLLARATSAATERTISLVLSEEASHLLYTSALDGVGAQLNACRLTFDLRPETEAVAAMLRGAYDIGLLVDGERALQSKPFWQSRLVVALSRGRSASSGAVALGDLADEPFILRQGRRYEASITQEMSELGMERRISHVANDERTQFLMFRENLGSIIVPEEQAAALHLAAAPLLCDTRLRVTLACQPCLDSATASQRIVDAFLSKSNMGAGHGRTPQHMF